MTTEPVKRKLSAILSADVEGYSRLMGEDEVGTVRTITAYRELIVSLIQKHRGRVVDAPGDNLLAEFASVVDAVECAVEIQRELEVRNAGLPENRMMKFRIGINLGDVIEEGERIYGDGVNIAARIEAFADGGTICISGTVYDQVKRKLPLRYEFLGKRTVKNIADPVRMYLVPTEAGAAAVGPSMEKRANRRYLKIAALSVAALLILGIVGLVIWHLYPNGDAGYQTTAELKPITVLIRMMEPQERWFTENLLKEFEQKNNCKIILKRFGKDYELVDILKKDAEAGGEGSVSLVKTPLHLTLLLYKAELVIPYEKILRDMGFEKPEIESLIRDIQDDYDPVALEMGKFTTITGEKLYFLPRKLETRLMVYRKSKVTEALENWHKFRAQIQDVLKRENGYGLPEDYSLESDINQWDFYDLLVVGYYWANTEHNGKKMGRIAHRSKNYAGTVIGLIDRALQLGALKEDIRKVDKSSKAIIDMFHWESIFRKYNLYSLGMWEDDGLFGFDIYKGIEEGDVFLTWLHQLDCMLLYRMDQLGMANNFVKPDDLGVSIMPQGVSFELNTNGRPKRIGTREAHTFAWFWGIPKGSPEPELAYKLAMFISSHQSHLEESKNFFLVPVRKSVHEALKADLKEDWQIELYDKSIEQFKINGNHSVPRFKTLAGYQEFLKNYYDAFEKIVIKKGYDQGGQGDKVDRNFIRENINDMSP
jgi:class 3 adenylate cyclase/ABC-type glycerol-3-phosphate transport system substrate-binding protein